MSMIQDHEYQIIIEGLLPDGWSEWLEGLDIHAITDEHTMLQGCLADQAALLGVLTRIHGMNLKIIVCQAVAAGRLTPLSPLPPSTGT